MSPDLILTNARIVTEDAVLDGTVLVRDGRIAALDEGRSTLPTAVDLDGDWLLPGFVELHTDNLERQFEPRPKVRWPADAAMLAHDGQVAAAGITTVCDAVCVGFYGGKEERLGYLKLSLDLLRRANAADALKSEHLLHLRLEVTDPHCVELFEPLMDEPRLSLVSFMDHTPGQRQWRDREKHKAFLVGRGIRSEAEIDGVYAHLRGQQQIYAAKHRAELMTLLQGHPAVRASHDDTTPEHIAEARAMGASISEFPTTIEAARAAREAGMAIVMGAPNLVLGGSHSGNVAAATLAGEGLLDAFSSDYVPTSLAQSVFLLRDMGWAMPEAAAPVTRNPARMLGLEDRGRIAPTLRADLVQVREIEGAPAVRGVWREGRRIA